MASVINSARNSTASVFDFVGSTANAANQLVGTAARSIDALDAKTQLMHKRVVADARVQMLLIEDETVVRAATQHTDLMEESHRRNFPNKDFDRESFYLESIKRLKEAVQD